MILWILHSYIHLENARVCSWILHFSLLNSEFILAGWLLELIKGLTCIWFSLFLLQVSTGGLGLWIRGRFSSNGRPIAPLSLLCTSASVVSQFTVSCFAIDLTPVGWTQPLASISAPSVPARNQWRRMTRWWRADSCALLRQSQVWQGTEPVGSYCTAGALQMEGERKRIKIQMAKYSKSARMIKH